MRFIQFVRADVLDGIVLPRPPIERPESVTERVRKFVRSEGCIAASIFAAYTALAGAAYHPYGSFERYAFSVMGFGASMFAAAGCILYRFAPSQQPVIPQPEASFSPHPFPENLPLTDLFAMAYGQAPPGWRHVGGRYLIQG